MFSRRHALAAVGAAAALGVFAAHAQSTGNPVKALLGQASDHALDQLAKPGAFSADEAIRIALPGAANLGKLLDLAHRSGLAGDLNGSLNRAAEQAAAQAKPIFRAAIDRASFSDAVEMARGGDTGATDYLKKSTGTAVQAQLLPLVRTALQQSGVLAQASQLSALGFDEARLSDYVAGKTSEGIFTYVGREEAKLRKDPIGAGRSLLKGMQGLKF